MGVLNGNGDGRRLEAIAENAHFKVVARAAMLACPVVCAIIGYLIDDKLKSIDSSLAELRSEFGIVKISIAVAATENRARDEKIADMKHRLDVITATRGAFP